MTKGFWKTGAIILLSSTTLGKAVSLQAQTCAVAPTCESLGYTMTATNCTGKKALKCPFDTNKLYCVTEAGLANVNLGDVMFSDHTTSSPYTYIAKTPIGVVIGKTSDSLIIAMKDNRGTTTKGPFRFSAVWSGKIEGKNGAGSGGYASTNYQNLLQPVYEELKDWQNSDDGQSISKIMNKWEDAPLSGTLADYGAQYVSGRWSGSDVNKPASAPLPDDFNVEGIFFAPADVFRRCNSFKTAGTVAGDWYVPSSKELENYGIAYINFTTTKYENKYLSVEGLAPFVGYLYTANFSVVAQYSSLYTSLLYRENAQSYSGGFHYQLPEYMMYIRNVEVREDGSVKVYNGGYPKLVCVTKIKI